MAKRIHARETARLLGTKPTEGDPTVPAREIALAAKALERQQAKVRKARARLRAEERKAKELRRALRLWLKST